MLAYVALAVCAPCATGHVDHTEQSGRPAGREREHNAAAERLTDSDRARAVGIRPSRDDLERTVEIIGLNLEAAGQIGILARHVRSATGYAWQTVRLAVTASQDHYGEPAAGGKIARLRQHHVGAQGLVLLGFGILAVGDQRDRKTAVRLRGLYDQRFQPEAPLVVLNRQKSTLLQQFVVPARSGGSHR